ncbi:hypothetical protein ACFE04_029008 [Oxalis oulophora]
MGASHSFQNLVEEEGQQPLTTTIDAAGAKSPKKLALIPLIFLIYFEVSGGPYGEESTVGAAGPLIAILGYVIFPFLWSIPEALITAELATALPGNGGFVLWADKAFGPFWGSLLGSWKYLTGVFNLASFPVLCTDYLKLLFPILSSGWPRNLTIISSTLVLSLLNYTGLAVVGYTAVTLGIISIIPFLIMTFASIPKIKPARWLNLGQKGVPKNWSLYINTLFWNLNFWDSASTLAGEVENPQKIFPKALLSAGVITCLVYIIPLLAATGAIPLDQRNWVDGYFADAAEIIAGKWLKILMEMGTVLSIIGLYEAQMSSCVYQLVGMSDLSIVPNTFAVRSKWFGTPWVGILISTIVSILVSYMNFEDIISSVNFLYSLGMLLEFASFLWLRIKFPELKRPFKVPLRFPCLVGLCLVPSVFLVYVMTVASLKIVAMSVGLTIVGICWYFLVEFCKSRELLCFNNNNVCVNFE